MNPHQFRACLPLPGGARQRGWTLIELITVGAIIMVLTSIAAPSIRNYLERLTEKSTFNLLRQVATLARTRAIREQQHFTVCASDNLLDCKGDWNHQIMVFSDPNHNETVDSGEVIHKAITLPEGAPCIHWQASLGRNYLQFKPSGASNGSAGHFRLCDTSASYLQKKLVISLNGRTSVQKL